MKQGQVVLGAVGLVVAAILAFFLQDIIRRVVLAPLSYIMWVFKFYFTAIPQLLLWIMLLAGLVLIAVSSLVHWFPGGRREEEPPRPPQGAVEILARWVVNSRKGLYYKWIIANRLGKLGQSITGRKPASEAVRRYLEAGLNRSFVDYPAPAFPFSRRKPTPFDLDVEQVVAFLESQMEENSG